MDATVRGVRLAYDDQGAGPPVVFVHAFPLNRTMWRRQAAAVAEAGWRAVTVDLRGFGESEMGSEPFTMDLCADDVMALLDHLGVKDPVVLVGLSMGGYVAFGCVRRHAQRLRALVLADTRAEPDTEEGRAGRLDTARRVEAEGVGPVVESMLPRLVGETTKAERPEVVAEVRAMMEAARPAAVARALRGLAERPDSRPELPRIEMPVLVVVGEEDAVTPPSAAQAMHEGIRGSRLVTIPGAGHLPNLETPEAFNAALLGFLSSLRG
ncbi:MAG TPA: alpha/beta fold hydrolase [Limnochordales bacterium]